MDEDLVNLAQRYAVKRNVELGERLGSGVHGTVFVVKDSTNPGFFAVKFHKEQDSFEREYRVYERLHDTRTTRIRGFNVPQLLNINDEFLAIEMTIVEPPFVLDFADARLDEPTFDFPADVLEQWEKERSEIFGERWAEVKSLIAELEALGIYQRDINPGNIFFA